jgi:hypothetical protein
MMGGDKSTWAPRPRILKTSISPPKKMESKVYKTGGNTPAPRIMGGDKSTWAPRPKMTFTRSPSPKAVAIENKREVTMKGGDKSTWGLTNSKAAIHEDIRRMARSM